MTGFKLQFVGGGRGRGRGGQFFVLSDLDATCESEEASAEVFQGRFRRYPEAFEVSTKITSFCDQLIKDIF